MQKNSIRIEKHKYNRSDMQIKRRRRQRRRRRRA
jgi:hypothetical protein